MAANLHETLNRLRNKSEVLIERYKALEEEKKAVARQNTDLMKTIAILKKELEQSSVDNEYLRLAKSISSNPGELEKSRAIISKLVRDVDKCISQLTE
ncbi:MAG: hypothetical protein RSC87_01490 [Muribaculaceae bacterium]